MSHPVNRTAELILVERQRRNVEALRTLWTIGDFVNELRRTIPAGEWRNAIRELGLRTRIAAKSLDEAARASAAFRTAERDFLLRCVVDNQADITPSHLIELARTSPLRRKEGLNALLRASHSVRDLRSYLHRQR